MSDNEKNVTFPLSEEEFKQRQKELNVLVDQAKDALKKATAFADKYHLGFSWDIAYGMGGNYQGDPDERWEETYDGWFSSSASCR